jgi:hypothetical protein
VRLLTIKPTLAVRGRRSGEWRTTPINLPEPADHPVFRIESEEERTSP